MRYDLFLGQPINPQICRLSRLFRARRDDLVFKGKQDLLAFEKETTRLDDFRNMLIWGDNKLVMASLLKQFKGKIDLIYIDSPFDVGADFTMSLPIGSHSDKVLKDQSILEMVCNLLGLS